MGSAAASRHATRVRHGPIHLLPDDCLCPRRLYERLLVRGLDGERQPRLASVCGYRVECCSAKDVYNILAKSILPSLFAGASCCIGGLGVPGSVAEIPLAT